MKYLKRSNIYKASNVTFDCETYEARSYSWWVFTKVINGQLVFNNYGYSNSTRKHQNKVRSLLNELNIPIDLEIEAPQGLQNLTSAIDYYEQRIASLQAEIAKPRSHSAKNTERQQKIKNYKLKIQQVKQLIKHQQRTAA